MAPRLALMSCVSCSLLLLLMLLQPGPSAAAPLSSEATSACRCTREFNAVCGNDGQTYSNKCLLECARVQGSSTMGQGLQMVRSGPC